MCITSALLTTLIKPMPQRACALNLMLEFMGFTRRSTSFYIFTQGFAGLNFLFVGQDLVTLGLEVEEN